MAIPKKNLPAFVRRCWKVAQEANRKQREEEVKRLGFYVGGELQWEQLEIEKRKSRNRPLITINKCKPAVDQIEGDIRLNPPGPKVMPVGGGADADIADIYEGIIRETEHRSDARTAYATAGKYSAAGGYAVIELATEYCNQRTDEQRFRIVSVEDPHSIFFDPAARMANRQDAMWAGRLRMYGSPEEYEAVFGKRRRVLEPRGIQTATGWIADAMGFGGSMADINEWTGSGKGPFYVVEFYLVELEPATSTRYSDHVWRFEDEPGPRGAKRLEGPENTRESHRRKLTKYVVDALEVLDETDWPGSVIPWIPVLGPEVYINGKLHRLSLISNAIDAQRALNYTATTATEVAGMMPRAPFIGAKGQFDDPRWQSANSELWSYLEYNPVHATDGATGASTLLPPPQRNVWESPIQWLLALGTYFSDAIKAVTSIYDPSLGQQAGQQSGRAIEQLRSESNVGNFSYSDNLHRAIGIVYGQIVEIAPHIMDGPQVVTIVRADLSHENIEINRIFGEDGIDRATGKKGKGNNIGSGEYAVRVVVGPNSETRDREATQYLGDFFKAYPQAMQVPGVAAAYLRLLGDGNPKIEQMGDLLAPPTSGDQTPAQLGQQLQQAQAQNQQLHMLVQKMQQALLAKLPEIEARKYIAEINALAGIREAEVKAGIDRAQMDEDRLEHLTGLAHDRGMQAAEHVHAGALQDQQAQQAQQQQQQQQQQQEQMQQPEPVGVNS